MGVTEGYFKNFELLLGIFSENFVAHIFSIFSLFLFFRVSWNGSDVKNSRIFWVEVVTGIEMSHLSFHIGKNCNTSCRI